jgi:predicted dehydrogenase
MTGQDFFVSLGLLSGYSMCQDDEKTEETNSAHSLREDASMATSRRRFVQLTATGAAALTAKAYAGAGNQPNERLRLAIMGVNGRGRQLATGFAALRGVTIATFCEVDDNIVPRAVNELRQRQEQAPRHERDLRRVLEDADIDAVVIAAPDHWHALATVWSCQAGKHVYVEKPVSHHYLEGRRMVEAARRAGKVVQVGTQRRSAGDWLAAAEFLRQGRLGRVPFARSWIAGNRPNIGRQRDGDVPRGVDYNLWLGPAPDRAFNPNRFHYKWHWHWDYGTGELGNNGIHGLDMVRMLLGLDLPTRICCGGGKFFYDDDQETPDTQIAVFDFANCSVLWEHRVWSRTGYDGQSWGVAVYGERGTMMLDSRGWRVVDGVEASERNQPADTPHYQNFLDCIRENRRPNADIEEGHKSTALCHLGNIALRLGRTLHFDPRHETIRNDDEATRLLRRTPRRGFEFGA